MSAARRGHTRKGGERVEKTVLIADDHRIVREGLRKILEVRPDLSVVAEADRGDDALEAALRHRPDLALIDIGMPGLGGIEVVRRIREQRIPTRCLVVSMHASQGYVTQALRAGAAGYVVKSAEPEELLEAIDAVLAGRSFVSPSVAHLLVDAVARPGAGSAGIAALTGRERDVLRLIAEGLSSREIASELGVSPRTVNTHRANLMAKLEVHKASALVRVAIEQGLVGAP